ncbi:MAG: hypothetical protein FWC93_03695 [Defluviitaleaceae bacterium]|nr:hypothetical protein [Defluviitaleaceae bacterium]
MKLIELYNENNERVGSTYPRRAKQLVRNGRASWLAEGHALLLASEVQTLPATDEEEPHMTDTVYQNNGKVLGESDDELLNLAKRKVADKKTLRIHIAIFAVIVAIFAGLFIDRVSTPRSLYGGYFNEAIWNLEEYFRVSARERFVNVREATSSLHVEEASWLLGEAQSAQMRIAYPLYIVGGILLAWGAWLAHRTTKYVRKYLQEKGPRPPKPLKPPKPPKLDPVMREYLKLKEKAGTTQ